MVVATHWSSIRVPIGVDEAGDEVTLDLVRDNHILIAGSSRSGKSVCLYTLLGGVRAMRAPVRVCGIDPTGILLAPYAVDPLVAVGVVDPERVIAILEELVAVMHDRLADLRSRHLDKFESVGPGDGGELYLVVLEEVQALYDEVDVVDRGRKPADRVKPRVEALIDALVAGSAKTQMKLLLSMQRASAKRFDSDTRANFSTRISFRVDDDESLAMLFPGLDRDTVRRVQGFGPGMGLVKTPGASVRAFRGDYSAYSSFRRLFD